MLVVALALTPFVFPGTRSMAAASRIAIFIVLAASYDMLLGYTGIVSFAHTMFFGIGAYGVAIRRARLGPAGTQLLFGTAVAHRAVRADRSSCIALLSLRVRRIFFSMVTLAVAILRANPGYANVATSPAARTG